MAVNKNFVVKNGIEVNTNLIVADTDSNKVGIGTTVPEYTLHVFEGTGIGASMVYVTGISTSLEEFNVGVGGTTFTAISNAAAGIAGSVGVGTDLPGYLLEVHAPVSTGQTALYVKGDMYVTGDINLDDITLNELKVTGISTFEDNIFVGSAATVGLHTVHFADHAKATFGDGEDLKIYHDESNSYILEEGTGSLIIDSNQLSLRNADTDNVLLDTTSAGAVRVRYNGNTKLETNTIGVEVSGTFQSTGITTLASAGGISTTGGDLYIGGDLYVSDNITLDTNLNILGIATIATLRVSDTTTGESGTEALIVGTGLSVRGSSTGVAVTLAGAGGITTTGGDFYVGGDLYISEDVILDTNLEIIGIATIGTLQVSSTSGINTILSTVESTSKDTGSLVLEGGLGVEKQLYVGAGASVGAGLTVAGDILPEADGTRDLGSSGAEFKDLYIDGTANIDSLSADTAAIGDLTDNRVVIAGTSGELEDSANLTFDGTTLTVGSGIGITTILDQDDMAANSATALASQQSIKAYVDNQITAEDLDFGGDSGTGSVDLDSQTFTIAGTSNEIETSASSQTLTIGLPNFVTVSNGLNVTGNGSTTTTLNVTGVSTFAGAISVGDTISLGDHDRLRFGAGNDLQIYHDESHSRIVDSGTGHLIIQTSELDLMNAAGTEDIIKATQDGSVEIYHNGTKKFETGPAGTITVGVGTFDGVSLGDNEKALFGASNDLQIYHDGSHSYVLDNGDGDLRLASNSITRITKGDSETCAAFNVDGASELYHDNSKKFETTGAGVTVTGVGTFSQSISIASSVYHLGDDNTHFGFPAADTFSVYTAGSERLRVTSAGELLVGTTSGDNTYQAHIKHDTYGLLKLESTNTSTDAVQLDLYHNSSSPADDDQLGIIGFKGKNSADEETTYAQIRGFSGDVTDGTEDGYLTFNTRAAGSFGERLRITSDGKLGLGEQSPDFKFHSKETGGSTIAGLFETNQTDSYISFQASGTTANSTVRIGAVSDNFVAFVNGGERLRIASSGQIGLGGANYGTTGQVLTSNGSGSAPTWQDSSGGGAGGISTTHQQVQSTTATGISTFSTTEYRSAHMLVGITQGTSYQTGRYLIIHDNTTPTILEESALATGDMIATFDATIAGGNLTVRVTMGNAGLATVAVKMDTIKSDSSS